MLLDRRNAMKRIISAILITILLCSLCFTTGCGLFDALFDRVPTTYDDPEEYTAGNTEFEGKVDTFNIWWLEGSVTVKTHAESTVRIEESANKTLDETFSLHWRYKEGVGEYGNVLYIYYSASGKFDFGDLKKDITVYLPENDGMDISITTDAASVEVDASSTENTLRELFIGTNSGKVSAKIHSAEEVRISGQNDEDVPESNREFFFRATDTVDDLGISSSYARLDIAAKTVEYGEVMTVFADLYFSADRARRLTLENSDGKTVATVLDFDTLDIDAPFAPCELTLSPDASFELTLKDKNRYNHKLSPKNVSIELDGVSGSGMLYTVGTGEDKITVATDSDLRIVPFVGEDAAE